MSGKKKGMPGRRRALPEVMPGVAFHCCWLLLPRLFLARAWC